MDVINRNSVPSFTTKDGSTIREILAPRNSVIERQSLAEAILEPGCSTEAHYHPITEEIYYILSGSGVIQIEDEVREVGVADAVAIPPGARHQIRNNGSVDLVFLCCCAPSYEHDDTVMVPALL
jgi:mannose-6-phosphate isomerase-like protein (cupin superfamily)